MGLIAEPLRKRVKRNAVVPVIAEVEAILPINLLSPLSYRFKMMSGVVPSKLLDSLADIRGIKKLYLDAPVWVPETKDINLMELDLATLRKQQLPIEKAHTTEETGKLLGVNKAHGEGITGQGVKVAIIDSDSSIRYRSHPQHGLSRVLGVSTHGFRGVFDSSGHGGHVTSTILGRVTRVREKVFLGMAPGATGLGIKSLFTPAGTGAMRDIVKAMDIAVDWGAKVINMSLGGPPSEDRLDDPLVAAITKLPKDVIVVAASGNESATAVGSPAYSPGVIAVGAIDPATGEVAEFSNTGVDLDTVAPGVDIWSGITPGTLLDAMGGGIPAYSILSGTSMASPHVAGILALMSQLYALKGQVLTHDIVMQMLQGMDSFSEQRGYGMITWDRIKEFAPA